MSSRFVRLVGLALLIPAVAWPQVPAPPILKLAPGDALRVEIKDEPTLSGQFAIGVDGAVLLPALGLVRAAGRPFPDVRDDLLQAYGKQLVDPVIRITPMVRVAVLGEVRMPGLYPVDPTLTVAGVIATAGGLTPMANHGSVSLVRDGRAMAAPFGPAWTTLNQSLQSGDQIVVSRKSWVSENTPFLLGALGSVAAAAIAGLIVR
jgi:polysaccharide export outer membrane protein